MAGTSTVIRTKLVTILLALQAQIMNKMALPEECVLILKRDLPYDSQADKLVLLRVRGQTPEVGIIDGGGRVDNRRMRRIDVTLRTRLALDEPTSDFAWLTDLSLGHLNDEHNLIDALECFQPVDANQNWLLVCPGRVGPVSEPGEDAVNREWGFSTLAYDVTYEMDLDQTYQ